MAKKLLNGSELAGYIKERQAKQVRMLRQAHKILPKVVIVKSSKASAVIESYVRLKAEYASDILIEFEQIACDQTAMLTEIERLNNDATVHGIVVQLPLDNPEQTDEIVDAIAPEKDIDGLGKNSNYISATAEAIDWLLTGYGVELASKKIVIAGRGRLVGKPLIELWTERGLDITTLDKQTENPDELLRLADVIITATGQPRLVHGKNVATGAVVVDAGTASEDGKIVGDIDPTLVERDDLTITPIKGGVGPLTIVLLFDHVIRAALATIEN